MKLLREFYLRDTLTVAKDLIGKILVTNRNGNICKGIIVETEAYCGFNDKACHSYKNRTRRGRTNIMYNQGGYSYVYLIYGMYNCFNIVSNKADIPEAVLIRAVEPVFGIDLMCERRGVAYVNDISYKSKYELCSGPGKLCKAFDITRDDYGVDLCDDTIYIEEKTSINKTADGIIIFATKRINIEYAEEDSLLPYRFIDKNSKFLSQFKI